jgi:hypothetical protein
MAYLQVPAAEDPLGCHPLPIGHTPQRTLSAPIATVDCGRMTANRKLRRSSHDTGQKSGSRKLNLRHAESGDIVPSLFTPVLAKDSKSFSLARTVHDLYFELKYEEFKPRTIWSLSNAFTSAFKALDPVPQFKAAAKLGEFLEARFSQSF